MHLIYIGTYTGRGRRNKQPSRAWWDSQPTEFSWLLDRLRCFVFKIKLVRLLYICIGKRELFWVGGIIYTERESSWLDFEVENSGVGRAILHPANGNGGKKRISVFFLYKIEIVDRLSVPYFSTCIDTLFLNQILLRRQFRSFDSIVSPRPFNVCGRTRLRFCQQMTPCHRRNNGQQLNWINSARTGSFFSSFQAMEDQIIPAGETLYKIPVSLSDCEWPLKPNHFLDFCGGFF